MRLLLVLAALAALSGCAQAGEGDYSVQVRFSHALTDAERADLEGLAEPGTVDYQETMSEPPIHFAVIAGLRQDRCEAVRQAAGSRSYVSSVGTCGAES